MVKVAFSVQEDTGWRGVCQLTVDPRSSTPHVAGDASFINFAARPYSEALASPVGFTEHPDEWARSLARSYVSDSRLRAEVIADSGPVSPLVIPALHDISLYEQRAGDRRAKWWEFAWQLLGAAVAMPFLCALVLADSPPLLWPLLWLLFLGFARWLTGYSRLSLLSIVLGTAYALLYLSLTHHLQLGEGPALFRRWWTSSALVLPCMRMPARYRLMLRRSQRQQRAAPSTNS